MSTSTLCFVVAVQNFVFLSENDERYTLCLFCACSELIQVSECVKRI